MERKAKLGLNVLVLLDIIYTILGGIFLLVGLILGFALKDSGGLLFGLIFGGIGGIFFILGIVFLLIEWKKKKQADALLAQGRYLWGEIRDLVPNPLVRINGRNPLIAVVCYTDIYGKTHLFRSKNLSADPCQSLIGRQVKVYYQNASYQPYYVDMESVLSTMT